MKDLFVQPIFIIHRLPPLHRKESHDKFSGQRRFPKQKNIVKICDATCQNQALLTKMGF